MRFDCVSRTHVGLRRKINEDSIFAAPIAGCGRSPTEWAATRPAMSPARWSSTRFAQLPVVYGPRRTGRCRGRARCAGVNRELIELARSSGQSRTIGTTVVGLRSPNGEFRCFWVGDSRAYRFRDGQIRRAVSRDHSLVQELVDAGCSSPRMPKSTRTPTSSPARSASPRSSRSTSRRGDARPGDLFLLASDGLTRVVDDDEIARGAAARVARGSRRQADRDWCCARRSGQCLARHRQADRARRPPVWPLAPRL